MRTTFVQTNFAAGEFSPRMRGRTDFNRYRNAVAQQLNFTTMLQGGATRRPGTHYVAPVKDSADSTRLIPFSFSTGESYILEFGDLYVRFYRDGAQLESAPSTPTEKTTPYTTGELAELIYCQSADVLYITHKNHPPQTLTRGSGADTATATWTIADHPFNNGPWLALNDSATTLTPAAATGSGIALAASTNIFASTDVDRLVRISNPASGTSWGWARITAFTDAQNVTIDIISDFATANASTTWQLGAWGDTTGWPQVCELYQARLWFAATADQPATAWSSRIDQYTRFAPAENDNTVLDTHAMTITIADNQVNKIRAMASTGRGIVFFTTGGAFLGRASQPFSPITPTDFSVLLQGTYGIHNKAIPIRVNDAIVYVTDSGETLRELAYSWELDQFRCPDMTSLSGHLTAAGGGVQQLAYASEPHSIVWAMRADGVLLGFTYERTEEVLAWHGHIIGGSFGGNEGGVVKSIAVIRDSTDRYDQLWLIVQRTINGGTVQYVEYLAPFFDTDHEGVEQADAHFVDSGLVYDGAATTAISGLDHLEGEVVSVLADGAEHDDKTVTSGAITLDVAASVVHVGLGFASRLRSLPVVPPAGIDSRAKIIQPVELKLELLQSLGGHFGPWREELGIAAADGRLDPLNFRAVAGSVSVAPQLFTGLLPLTIDAMMGRDPMLVLQVSQPTPFTVLAIIGECQVGSN